jgi:hypothetical protein
MILYLTRCKPFAMRTYTIEGEANSPNIFLDESKSLIEISGNSTLKDATWFYSNVLRWIIAFNSGNSKTRTININLQHINDSSLIWLETIIRKLTNCAPASDFEINWYNTEKNKSILARALTLQNNSGKKVNLV